MFNIGAWMKINLLSQLLSGCLNDVDLNAEEKSIQNRTIRARKDLVKFYNFKKYSLTIQFALANKAEQAIINNFLQKDYKIRSNYRKTIKLSKNESKKMCKKIIQVQHARYHFCVKKRYFK